MKVLVTGANGFLGSHVVRELLKKKYDVRAFILKGTKEDTLEGLEYEAYHGNLLDSTDIDHALDSCDYVIHTAGITDVWPTKNEMSWKINFEVVKNLADSVRRNQIKKYVHVGTANSFGFGSIDTPGTEKNEFNGLKYGLDYIDSKKAAQDHLLGEVEKIKLPVVIINPTFMIGEFDSKPGPGEIIVSVIKRKIPGYASGGRCFSAVKDVAKACVSALENGRIGECYITGGTNLCYKDFFSLVAKIANVKPPKPRIPLFISMMFAGLLELSAKIRKRKPRLTRAMAKISADGHYYSSEKAVKELGYSMTNLEIALSEAIEWYGNNGYL